MEKDRSVKVYAMIAMIISIVGASVGFAAISTTLNIRGSATLENGGRWDIHFSNLNSKTVGNAVEKKSPVIKSDTYIGDFDITFKGQDDAIEYTFDIVNDGDFDAKISTLTFLKPTCESTKGNLSDNELNTVCGNVEYTLLDDDSRPIAIGNVLSKKERKSVKLKIKYTGTTIPTEDITINDLGAVLLYSQK